MSQVDALNAKGIAPWIPFEWLVAIRFLREGKVQTFFIIGGVAIGVGVICLLKPFAAADAKGGLGLCWRRYLEKKKK